MRFKGEVTLDARQRRAEQDAEDRAWARRQREWRLERRAREVRQRRRLAAQKRFARQKEAAERNRQRLRHPFIAWAVAGRYYERAR